VELDFDSHRAVGTVTITLQSAAPRARQLILDAIDLQEVMVSGSHPLSWSYDGAHITICFDEGAPSGEERRVTVNWSVHRPISGMFFGGPSPDCPQRGQYMVTDHETERARYWSSISQSD